MDSEQPPQIEPRGLGEGPPANPNRELPPEGPPPAPSPGSLDSIVADPSRDPLQTMEGWVRSGRAVVPAKDAGRRLDQYLAGRFTYRSRTSWAERVREGTLLVGGRRVRPSHIVREGDLIEYKAPPLPEPPVDDTIHTLYEDDAVLAVSKSGNLPVHPSGRYFRNTLLFIVGKGRPQDRWLRIVHRIDRETSGVLLFAKTLEAAQRLGRQFEDRLVSKAYLAVVWGEVTGEREINSPLGFDPRSRIRKAVHVVPDGRPSKTVIRPLSHGDGVTLVEALPLTGRIHQIRAHLKSVGHPILGDKMYGRDEEIFLKFIEKKRITDKDLRRLGFRRQLLHAWKLRFRHPQTGKVVEIQADPPGDFLEVLRDRGLDVSILGPAEAAPVRWPGES